jgi:hypothetical protein
MELFSFFGKSFDKAYRVYRPAPGLGSGLYPRLHEGDRWLAMRAKKCTEGGEREQG